jgi:uncharacterized membrane protein YfcA
LIGAGGAVVAVPAFLYLFGFDPLAATTASLAIVAASATAGAVPRFRLGQVRIKQGLTFWALGIVGTFLGSRIAPAIPEVILVVGFALVMVGAAIAMWRKSSSAEPAMAQARPAWLLPVVAISVGVLTGLFGVGGGFLIVPALVLVFGLPFGLATGTSLLVVALNSVTALLFKFDSWSTVDWRIPALVIIGGLVGSVIASRGSARVSRRLLERIFAVLLVVLSLGMVIQVTGILG